MNIEQLSGQKLGQYELRELLGKGAMSVIYRTWSPDLQREVIAKILLPTLTSGENYEEQFNRVMRQVMGLRHPNIPRVESIGNHTSVNPPQKLFYIIRQDMDNGSLADRMHDTNGKPRLPSLQEAHRLLRRVADALDYAHAQDVVHAALNPRNIMFDHDHEPYIVDFGIARLSRALPSAQTGVGMIMGTPEYMAPEQWRGEAITKFVDQYVFAVILYQVLTGVPPFEASTPYALMHKHITEMPAPVHTLRPDSSEALADVFNKALAKKPEDRFETMRSFADAFHGEIFGRENEATDFFNLPSRAVQRHIFLSYSHNDTAMMGKVRDGLRAAGLMVWTDETLTPGTPSWKKSIEKAIEEAGALVVLLSPDSKNSEWVERELGYARVCNVRIFPVLCRGDERNAIPFELVNTQRADIRDGNFQAALTSLVSIIRNQLSQLV